MEQNRNFGKNTQFCDDVGGKENFLNLRRWRSHLLSSFIFKTLSLRNWECTQYLHMFSVRLSKQPVKEPWELILNVKCRNSCSFPSIYIKQKPGSLVERSTQTTGHLTGTKWQAGYDEEKQNPVSFQEAAQKKKQMLPIFHCFFVLFQFSIEGIGPEFFVGPDYSSWDFSCSGKIVFGHRFPNSLLPPHRK